MKKKTIKLVNNERIATKISSVKACATTSYDVCGVDGYDVATCHTYAFDECGKDYQYCSEGADDICVYIDRGSVCSGAGTVDKCDPSDYT